MQSQGTIGIYYKTWCSYSQAALAVLEDLGITYTAIDVTTDPVREAFQSFRWKKKQAA